MDEARKRWNKRQKKLRMLLQDPEGQSKGLQLFMQQHAEVHSAETSEFGSVSFEDETLDGLSEGQFRVQPPGFEHSIAWILWHLARIEDVTMNMLVAGEEQLFAAGDWKTRIGAPIRHSGNAMTGEAIGEFSEQVDIAELRLYRIQVGRRTEVIVSKLTPGVLNDHVSPSRLERVVEQGVVVSDAQGVIDYWSRRTIAGLLLMPPTRHCFIHLNQALQIRKQALKQDNN